MSSIYSATSDLKMTSTIKLSPTLPQSTPIPNIFNPIYNNPNFELESKEESGIYIFNQGLFQQSLLLINPTKS